jgi:pSer/pThr/pTyr-binding forkhead associated (FHA) protein
VRVGRTDETRSIYPDVDLSSLDPRRAVSRLHAQIRRKGEQWFIVEENGVPNGTWVNNRRIQAGVEMPIKHGDSVRLAGVRLIFEERKG